MRAPTRRRVVVAAFVAFLMGACFSASTFAQDVKAEFDKNENFAKLKKYKWGKNYLLTHQVPQDQERIYSSIVKAIDADLQGKGFVHDEQNPDFIVLYNGGGIGDIKVGAVLDTSGPSYVEWSSTNLGGAPLDVWNGTVGKLQIVIQDAQTKVAVWQGLGSKKIREPNKVMNDLQKLDKMISDIVKKTMKSFPPKK